MEQGTHARNRFLNWRGGGRGLFLLTALALLVVSLLVRAIALRPAVINPDESIFALSAREILHGHLPYLTLFDNKPVGSALMIAGMFKLFGVSIPVVRLLGTLCVWASSILLLVLILRSGLGRLQAVFAALLYIAFASTMTGFATLTEILLAPFSLAGVVLLRETLDLRSAAWRLLLFALAGLAFGWAILIKIVPLVPGLAVAGAVAFTLLRRRVTRKATACGLLAMFTGAAALPMLIAALVYSHAGHLGDFLYANFGFAHYYAASNPKLKLVATRLVTVVDSVWPLLVLAAVCILSTAFWLRQRRGPEAIVGITFVWLLAELVAAAASRHFYPHYFLIVLPPLILLASLGIRILAGWMAAGRPGLDRAVLILSLIAVLIPLERTEVETARDLNAKPDVARILAAAIHRADHGVQSTLFVTNYQLSVLYLLTRAPLPPTRFPNASHLFSRQSAMIRTDPRIETARVLASHPRFIVIDASDRLPGWAVGELGAALDTGYRRIDQIGTVSLYEWTRS